MTFDISNRIARSGDATKSLRLIASFIVIAIGCVGAAAWLFDISVLKAILPGSATMKINTAVGLTAGGTATALMTLSAPRAKPYAAALVSLMGLLGLLTLIEYLAGTSLGIDELLAKDFDTVSQPFYGRMSPITAAGFVALATSSGLLVVGRSRMSIRVAHGLAWFTMIIALLAVTGYAYGSEKLYGLSPYLSVALHTGIGLALLAGAALLTRSNEGWANQFFDRPIATAAFLRIALISVLIPFVAGLLAVLGMREGLYQAAFSPPLFAVATAAALVGLALRSARILAKAEDNVRTSREEARVSEARLGLALSSGRGIGTWEWNVQGDRFVADERFARLYGVDLTLAAGGAPIAEFFRSLHPDDLPRIDAAIEAALRTGVAFSEEYRLATLASEESWVFLEGRCELSADGAPLQFLGVSFDITDRKVVETQRAALLKLSDELRDLTDLGLIAYEACRILGEALGVSRVGYGLVNKETETISIERDWNAPGVKSLAGVLRFRDYGSYIDDLKRGETVVVADAKIDPRTRTTAAALIGISAHAFVNMPLVEQGGFVALLFANNATARTWRDGDLQLMRQFADRVRTATERVRAENARRQSEEHFRVFAHAVPNHIWASRPEGYLDWFNEQLCTYSGETPATLEGTTAWGRIIHPDDLAAAEASWMRSLATGDIYETEFRIRRADGAYRWFLVRAEPVRAADGSIVRWVGTNTDVDEPRRQALELARLNSSLEAEVDKRTQSLMAAEEQLRQSQKMEAVGQLTGGLAHDFNNLLTGITGSLELLSARIAQGRIADTDRFVLAAQGAAKRAAALTHRLLAFSRRQTLDPRPTDANRLITGMEELVRRTVGPAVNLSVVTAGGLWPTLVDPNQLENAILNLCINAHDAMPDGGRLTIESGNKWLDQKAAKERQLEPGQYISLCVSDTGTGMTPDVISKAFDPFFTTKPIGQGTGLGLSMVYGFVRQSGGQVRIYSEP